MRVGRRFDAAFSDPLSFALLIFILLWVSSAMDHKDAERQHEHYCEMVRDGHWPDFKRLDERGECDEQDSNQDSK